MEQDILEKLEAQDKKIDAIYGSVEKIRKYFLWTFIVTVVTFVLPLLVLAAVIPWFLKILTSSYGL